MSARTEAQIGAETRNGAPCENCGTSYAACTRKVLGKPGRACCGPCGHHDTHDEKPRRLAPTFPDSVNLTAFAQWVVLLHTDTLLGGPYRGAIGAWCEATGAPDDETGLAWARQIADARPPVTAAIPPF